MRKIIDAKPSLNAQASMQQQQPTDGESAHKPLTNEDFRKMLTPRVLPVSSMQTPDVSVERPNDEDPRESGHTLFCNPEPPNNSRFSCEDGESSQRSMGNEDFRKMMMTPNSRSKSFKRKREDCDNDYRSENVKKASKFESPFRVQPENKLSQIARKFKNIVKEQSDDASSDHNVPSASGYHAVAPYGNSDSDAVEENRRKVQESKYLGGEMDNTYLVKGLDVVLLQKTREEIMNKEKQREEAEQSRRTNEREAEEQQRKLEFKTKLGKNIYEIVFRKHPERNEMFDPNLVFHSYNFKDKETDMPVTVMRSKTECSKSDSRTLTTNDIVMANVIKTLSTVRQGKRDKGVQKARNPKENIIQQQSEKLKTWGMKNPEDSIFGDIGDYVPSFETSKSKETEKVSDTEKPRKPYFKESDGGAVESSTARVQSVVSVTTNSCASKLKSEAKSHLKEISCYAECYPGAIENEDALVDSDEEPDYRKMDSGTSKGSLGRWDFETEEEYSSYTSGREALPKAAFQYGVKMGDGRKTRNTGNKFRNAKLDRTKKLDRELQKINRIIGERKNAGMVGSGRTEAEYAMRTQ